MNLLQILATFEPIRVFEMVRAFHADFTDLRERIESAGADRFGDLWIALVSFQPSFVVLRIPADLIAPIVGDVVNDLAIAESAIGIQPFHRRFDGKPPVTKELEALPERVVAIRHVRAVQVLEQILEIVVRNRRLCRRLSGACGRLNRDPGFSEPSEHASPLIRRWNSASPTPFVERPRVSVRDKRTSVIIGRTRGDDDRIH